MGLAYTAGVRPGHRFHRAGSIGPVGLRATIGVMRRQVLVVDGANVVGSRPDGWWRDRAGAARRLHGRLAVADTSYDVIVLVLEGKARAGVPAGTDGHLCTVHASRDGDSAIVAEARAAVAAEDSVVVITADRGLQEQVEVVGARVLSPSWLLSVLDDQ
jgi:predicted RNA-binding protein with PIN domain